MPDYNHGVGETAETSESASKGLGHAKRRLGRIPTLGVSIMATVKSSKSVENGIATAPTTFGPADLFFLLSILSALPWGLRVKAMAEALSKLTPEEIRAAVKRFQEYHEAVLVKLHNAGTAVPTAVYNAQWEIVGAIRSGESAIVKAATDVLEKKEKAAKGITKDNKTANTPVRELFADLMSKSEDIDPSKV